MSRFHEKTFPGETPAYREARDQLLQAELDLRARVEEVAALRRKLPDGGLLARDYAFDEARGEKVATTGLGDLFTPGKDTLLVYNFMYGPDWEKPCPMCTSFIDSLNQSAAYALQRVNLAVVARAPVERLQAWGRERGWHRLRLLSSARNTFNKDYNAQFPSDYGEEHPVLHAFVRRPEGIRHFWSSEMLFAVKDGQPRHVDQLWPIWNILDLTPEGRGTDWYPNFEQ